MQGHFCLSKDILGSIKWKIKRQMLVERAKYYAPGEDGKGGVQKVVCVPWWCSQAEVAVTGTDSSEELY